MEIRHYKFIIAVVVALLGILSLHSRVHATFVDKKRLTSGVDFKLDTIEVYDKSFAVFYHYENTTDKELTLFKFERPWESILCLLDFEYYDCELGSYRPLLYNPYYPVIYKYNLLTGTYMSTSYEVEPPDSNAFVLAPYTTKYESFIIYKKFFFKDYKHRFPLIKGQKCRLRLRFDLDYAIGNSSGGYYFAPISVETNWFEFINL